MSLVPRPYSPAELSRKVLLTSSFPYASSPLRVGQLVDALQADILARFLRLVGREVVFVGGVDSHGTDVQLNAAAAGVEPEELAERYRQEHLRDFRTLHIDFSAFNSTHGEDNRELSVLVFNRLREKGYIYEKEIPLDYCNSCRRFLPDRFDRGRCPGCGAAVRNGGLCPVCCGDGQLSATSEPRCPNCGGEAEARHSRHYFFRLSEFSGRLSAWVRSGGGLQPEVEQWVDSRLREGLDDWCISRDAPYFGFPVPGELKKFFCVWLDAPLGYLSGTAVHGGRQGPGREPFWHDGASEIIQFVRRDNLAFHTLFWPAVLMGADFSLPNRIVAQGFLTVGGRRLAGQYGPRIIARDLAEYADPECLRYAVASRLGSGLEEIDLSPEQFAATVNEELGGLVLRFISGALERRDPTVPRGPVPGSLLRCYSDIGQAYAAVDFRQALARIREVVRLAQDGRRHRRAVCRDLAILLMPVLPHLGQQLEVLLGADRPWSWNDLGTAFSDRVAGSTDGLVKRLDCRGMARLLGRTGE
jgi:methionyl-tRNA synthetase